MPIHFVDSAAGDSVDIKTPLGTLLVTVTDSGDIYIRSALKGDGSSRTPSFIPFDLGDQVRFSPNAARPR